MSTTQRRARCGADGQRIARLAISIGIFGLTPAEIVVGGGKASLLDAAHHARLYRWGRCTCHPHLAARGPRMRA